MMQIAHQQFLSHRHCEVPSGYFKPKKRMQKINTITETTFKQIASRRLVQMVRGNWSLFLYSYLKETFFCFVFGIRFPRACHPISAYFHFHSNLLPNKARSLDSLFYVLLRVVEFSGLRRVLLVERQNQEQTRDSFVGCLRLVACLRVENKSFSKIAKAIQGTGYLPTYLPTYLPGRRIYRQRCSRI